MRFLHLVALGLAMTLAVSACAKSSSSTNASETSNAEGSSAPAAAESAATTAAASAGETAYTANCASCHQANGKGVAGSFPPLAGNPTVTGDPKKLIHIVKYGINGKIMVGARLVQRHHAALGVATLRRRHRRHYYVHSNGLGNTASEVTAADVSAVKK